MIGRKRRLLVALAASAALVAGAATAHAEAPSTRAKQAVLTVYPTMAPLLRKDAAVAMAPSSMAKLMTAYLVFDALDQGRLAPDTHIAVSRAAAAVPGAKLGLRAGERVSAAQLVEGMIVHSANDAAIALAEHLAETEAAFARHMTERAAALGLRGSRFRNATGHTARGQQMTAEDVATLSGLLLARFPKHYELFSRPGTRFRGTTHRNRNPLLGRVAGVDGLKTGQTTAGGFGLAVSAERNGRRLILVLNGLGSERERAAEAERLLEWGFKTILSAEPKPAVPRR